MSEPKTVKARCVVLVAALAAAPIVGAQPGTDQERDALDVAQQCITHQAIRTAHILGDRNIVFTTRDGSIYNNELPRQCPSLRRNSVVNYSYDSSQLCAGATFEVMWETRPRSFAPAFVCRLGEFVPITKTELAELEASTEPDRTRSHRRRSAREAVTTEPVEPPPAQPPLEEQQPNNAR